MLRLPTGLRHAGSGFRRVQTAPSQKAVRPAQRAVATAAASPEAKDDVSALFQPFKLPGGEQLLNRMVYPPLTRCRAPGSIPQPHMAEYYAQRACPGSLVIAEATQVDSDGNGYPHTPGLFNAEQTEGWKQVTKAVKDKGAVFFCQLWHAGRASHPVFQPDGKRAPVSSSAVAITSEAWKNCYLGDGQMGLYPVPSVLDQAGIQQKVQAFRKAARNAIDAGFQGIELHAANGYLIDQFTKDGINKRTDEYGGSIENRCRFALEVVDACAAEIGAERVGIRLSPCTTFLDAIDSTPYATFTYLVEQLNKHKLAYLHMVEARVVGNDEGGDESFSLEPFRKIFKGPFIAAGGYTKESGAEAIASGKADLVAYGRWWISNPDLPERFKLNAPLNKYDRDTFYSHGMEGYLDYPFMEGSSK